MGVPARSEALNDDDQETICVTAGTIRDIESSIWKREKIVVGCHLSVSVADMTSQPLQTRPPTTDNVLMIKAVRGTRDLLPPDTDLWNRVDAKVRDISPATTFTRSARPSSKTRSCSPAASAKRPTSCRRDVHVYDKARAQSEKTQSLTFVRRILPAWCVPTSSTASTAKHAAEAVLHRSAVSARASAEGPLPSSSRLAPRSSDRPLPAVISRPRRRSAGDAGHAARRSRPARLESAAQLRWLCRRSRPLQQGATGGVAAGRSPDVFRLQRRAETNPLRVLDCKVTGTSRSSRSCRRSVNTSTKLAARTLKK